MEHLVITTGFSQSGWSRGPAALARDQFAVGVDEILESWRAQVLREVEAGARESLPLEQLAAWSSSLDPGRATLLSDERDLWLLDHWAEHCPQARFLLFYTDPESALIAALQAGADPTEFLDGWRTAAQRLVRFQRCHRPRSLLLDAEAARLDPRAMVEAARRIGLILRLDESLQPAGEDPVLERLVARRWLEREPDLALLQAELEAHAYPLGERPVVAEPTVDQLLELYRCEQAFRRRLTAERDAQARLAQENAHEAGTQSKLAVERGAELARTQERLHALEAQHAALETSRKQLEATRKQLETSHKELEATHKDTVEENELLLLQLHQVQEELEQYFLKYQELKGLQDEPGTTPASGSTESADKPAPKLQAPEPDRRRSKRPPALKSRGLFGKNRKERRRLERYVAIIRESGLFDEAWYLRQYPDVVAAGYDAIEHYVCHGRQENRHPAPWFDTAFYLEHNPDVANSIMNPLVHYHQFGQAERRPTRRGY